jgi:hypothetical protein
MLRLKLGEVAECCGKGIWRTDRGVGMGSVETDIPLSFAAGRLGDAAPDASGVDWDVARFPFCLDFSPLLAIVCRIVSCGVLGARDGWGDAFGEGCGAGVTTGVLLGFRCEVACHGETVGGTGCGFSSGVPSC